MVVEPTTRLTDSNEHDYRVATRPPQGEVTVAVRVEDEYDNQWRLLKTDLRLAGQERPHYDVRDVPVKLRWRLFLVVGAILGTLDLGHDWVSF